jgi:hypothetical protein
MLACATGLLAVASEFCAAAWFTTEPLPRSGMWNSFSVGHWLGSFVGHLEYSGRKNQAASMLAAGRLDGFIMLDSDPEA